LKLGRLELGVIDAVGAAVAVATTVGGIALLVHGPLRETAGLAAAQAQYARALRELADVQADKRRLDQEIDTSTQRLSAPGGGLPDIHQMERYLAHVTALASANGINVDSLVPGPYVDYGDHVAVRVSFTGRGGFVGFHRLLDSIEGQLEYVDVTHFGISSRGASEGKVCQLEWSLRIRAGRADRPEVRRASDVAYP
jgi:Tfp pilus assembly protein PilO